MSSSTSLNAARRSADLAALEAGAGIDVLVVGGGVTGAGAALDAASRGLSTVLVERRDLAFGTSRWSSKLVHGGLRYLAKGRVGIAYESARERDLLMRTTAPHLVRPLPMVVPVHRDLGGLPGGLLARAGMGMGDVLRRLAGTPASVLPRPRLLDAARTRRLLPGVEAEGLLGGVLTFDGQLVDDARLVLALARTAAGLGARIITRCSAETVTADGAVLRDEETGRPLPVRPRAVINATGVHADLLDPGIRLSPSRGSHLVLDGAVLGHPRVALTVPVEGAPGRFVFALPQPDGRIFLGLTDEAVDGPAPHVPEVPEEDVDFLLRQANRALRTPIRRSDVLGAFAGLRPLLHGDADSADLSREHSVTVAPNGAVTVVGGKLTTYRAMAQEAVDAAVSRHRLPAGPCRTRALPLVGAAPREELDAVDAPRRLVARYGTEAPAVLAEAGGDPALLEPVAAGITGAELRFGVRHEGALDADDLLERRTRIALVDADRAAARPTAEEALAAGV
ncbi:glycerol-3-phosphate dehydrogenase/oxidase [Nocardiopsis changdeensis]|uniref:Glycerol-3-phosphate dehydrogenase n=1 Tax=Nocardiopsis changdeensis TaxID=2831969 RepID=A0ABX8BKG5_9ACTN|nr:MULTISPECIES: glycerol-3-phosphate dehydrogenase/oxidase [Nocardiopsis]QUX21794.1 glycerol-3-phosphate dehydrogenase/oxidase [Nocardiopsis changdeensis]QYX37729.1 glycerol-3-phosphate dehydrogenase/oxidase [Nocardiopsis sp. MT53]